MYMTNFRAVVWFAHLVQTKFTDGEHVWHMPGRFRYTWQISGIPGKYQVSSNQTCRLIHGKNSEKRPQGREAVHKFRFSVTSNSTTIISVEDSVHRRRPVTDYHSHLLMTKRKRERGFRPESFRLILSYQTSRANRRVAEWQQG